MSESYKLHAYLQQAQPDAFEALSESFALALLGRSEAAKRRVRSGNHPDYLTVTPQAKRVYISVDQIRTLTERLSLHPYEGGRRAVVIYPADLMRPEAQNSLLKTLEEPPENTVFLLLTEYPARLLSTIQSRCALIRAATAPMGDTEEAARVLVRLTGGENAMDVAQAFPKDRTELTTFLTLLTDAAGAQLGGEQGGIFARIIPIADKALMMAHSNINTELCAQWFCLRVKEELTL